MTGRPARAAEESSIAAIRKQPSPVTQTTWRSGRTSCAPIEAGSYESHRPTVVVEVLSPSTLKIDRFTKLEEYRRHPSLRHILLVDPDAVAAKLYSRVDEGAWSDVDLIGGDAVVALPAIDVTLPLSALYERLDMPA